MTIPKVFVAIPIYGNLPYQFMESLMSLQARPDFELHVRLLPGDSLVSRARNTLTADFLKSDCTHLLFVDSDLIFSADQIARLLNHHEPVVAGFYPKKQQGPLSWVCNVKPDELLPDERGLVSVRYMGTGFLMVERTVFEMMRDTFPDLAYQPDHAQDEMHYDFWTVGVFREPGKPGRYLSEDWFFCQRWLDMGGKVYGDVNVILKHIGQAVYPLQTQIPELQQSTINTPPPPPEP